MMLQDLMRLLHPVPRMRFLPIVQAPLWGMPIAKAPPERNESRKTISSEMLITQTPFERGQSCKILLREANHANPLSSEMLIVQIPLDFACGGLLEGLFLNVDLCNLGEFVHF